MMISRFVLAVMLMVTVSCGSIPAGALPALSAATAATIYYVSPAGDNDNPGTREQPWATPGYGSRQLHAGDTLIILAGVYNVWCELPRENLKERRPATIVSLPPNPRGKELTDG